MSLSPSVRKEAVKVVTGSRSGFHVPSKGNKPALMFGLASLWGLSLTYALAAPGSHTLIPCLCFGLLLCSDAKASRRPSPRFVALSYHTLVTVWPSHQAFTEAASCLLVTGVSSRKCPQRAAGTSWTAATTECLVMLMTLLCQALPIASHLCSLLGHRPAHNERLCSGHSALPPRSLCSGTDQR